MIAEIQEIGRAGGGYRALSPGRERIGGGKSEHGVSAHGRFGDVFVRSLMGARVGSRASRCRATRMEGLRASGRNFLFSVWINAHGLAGGSEQ